MPASHWVALGLAAAAALGLTLARVPRGLYQQIIVADNGSRDRTAEIARQAGANVLTYQDSTGLTPYWISSLSLDPDAQTFTAQASGIVLAGLSIAFLRARRSISPSGSDWIAGRPDVLPVVFLAVAIIAFFALTARSYFLADDFILLVQTRSPLSWHSLFATRGGVLWQQHQSALGDVGSIERPPVRPYAIDGGCGYPNG